MFPQSPRSPQLMAPGRYHFHWALGRPREEGHLLGQCELGIASRPPGRSRAPMPIIHPRPPPSPDHSPALCRSLSSPLCWLLSCSLHKVDQGGLWKMSGIASKSRFANRWPRGAGYSGQVLGSLRWESAWNAGEPRNRPEVASTSGVKCLAGLRGREEFGPDATPGSYALEAVPGCGGRRDGRGGASVVILEPRIPGSFAELRDLWTLTWTSFKETHGPLMDKNMNQIVFWHSNPSTLGKHPVQLFEDPLAYHDYAFKI
ncbi:uncharacterized protein [Pseudorca crassidens]|uniref:uncharacterized protein n=1 Tax=Pseudorca crassidens TaxID=82174 RepID=UPI00352FADEB